ncbi:MAG: histidine phosphatase family protein [Myxococcales bacterium]|nr:histidine phosphatase family protein [Myxococcales bacterium]MDH5306002.1 histidine phosphatase family protein [Myxococcales bacterium]MDH5566373.1 histidine phosphatase family protein [Myxococcales bacterium]
MVRSLLLLRHASADSGPPALSDHDRPLSAAGRKAAERVGAYLARRVRPSLALCSSALRAVETLECLRAALLGNARVAIERSLYMASGSELLEQLAGVSDAESCVLVIGHNPGIQTLAASLATHADALERQRVRSSFPPAACALLRFDTAGWGDLSRGGRLDVFARPDALDG